MNESSDTPKPLDREPADPRFAKGKEWQNLDAVELTGEDNTTWVVIEETPDGKGVKLKNKIGEGEITRTKEVLLNEQERPVTVVGTKPKGWIYRG